MPLETGIQLVQRPVITPLEEAGLPPGVSLRLSGTADKLATTWDAMVVNLLVALVIVYLVMAVLFESFVYPLIVMVSVPVAAAGGVLGLVVLNLFHNQPLDMLTHARLRHPDRHRRQQRDPDRAPDPASTCAKTAWGRPTRSRRHVPNRIRPIFMSTLTSVFGMLPLVVFPGAGSELYRGLGSVVVGGLALSALLTLTLVPPLLGLFLRGRAKPTGARRAGRHSRGRQANRSGVACHEGIRRHHRRCRRRRRVAGLAPGAAPSVLLLEREEQPGYHSTGRSAAHYTEVIGATVIQALSDETRRFIDNPPDGFTDYPLSRVRPVLLLIDRRRPRRSFRRRHLAASMDRLLFRIDLDKCLEHCPV